MESDHHVQDHLKDRLALERVIVLAAEDPDIPSIGQSASRLAAADEDRQSIETICEIALSDPALAQKITRAAGSAAMGSMNHGKPWSLSRALMALGMEQVRAMAMALQLMDIAKTRQATLARTSIGEALAGCFCAREAARVLGADRDGWGLRTLFLGCLPFFIDLYDAQLGNRIKLDASIGNKPWNVALNDLCSMSEHDLLDRLLVQWGFPNEARKSPGPEPISSVALGLSRALNILDIKAAQEEFFKHAAQWDRRTIDLAFKGLAKGVNLGSLCSLAPRGALAKEALKKSSSKNSWDGAARYWEMCAATSPVHFEAALSPRGLLGESSALGSMTSVPLNPETQKLAHETKTSEPSSEPVNSKQDSLILPARTGGPLNWVRYASDLAQQALDGAQREDIGLQGLEALTLALGMERGLCAFGLSVKEASLVAVLGGGRPWAKSFVANRSKDKIDVFNHALMRGADVCCADAALMQSSLPVEIAPEGAGIQKAFAFFPLGARTKPRGYALFSSGHSRPAFSASEIEDVRGFFAQWALALAMAKSSR